MNKNKTPQELAEDILHRSTCRVKVGSVLVDRKGSIMSWGWNHAGNGFGCHAEVHAINRCNPKRLEGASIYVAGIRSKTGQWVPSIPCEDCHRMILGSGIRRVFFRDRTGWYSLVNPL